MAELLKELQIPVYYAPEHATTRFPPAETAALEHSDLGSEAWKIHVLNEQCNSGILHCIGLGKFSLRTDILPSFLWSNLNTARLFRCLELLACSGH